MTDVTSVALDFFGVRSERSQHKRKTDRLFCRCCAAAAYTLLVEYISTDCNLIVMINQPAVYYVRTADDKIMYGGT